MTNPTPGPWKEAQRSGTSNRRVYVGEICVAIIPEKSNRFDKFLPTPDEAKEYARLIAAAPETAAERDRLQAANKELLEEVEKLRADIKDINPAIKCRSGCHVVKERWGES